MILDELQKYNKYVIYGAQVIAVGAKEAIAHLTGRLPECFVVGKSKNKPTYPVGNPNEIDGIPVRPIERISKDMFIVVGVTELIQKEVLPFLLENDYKNFYLLTQHEEHLLMSIYYTSIGRFPLATEAECYMRDIDFVLYEVMNDRDKPLSYHSDLFAYERSIQAGAALSNITIAEYRDNIGINISEKNRMYCEMTAVYWIWKNTEHDWVGIEHYRRHLLVKPKMLLEDIDVIMPLPYICYPYEAAQFLRFTTENVLHALLKALKDLYPNEYEDYLAILYGKYQYTYNLFCAKRYVFDNYCRWFFEITGYMEKTMGGDIPELLETRAFSYVAEVLTNIYFMHHQKELKIRHAEKAIYI